MAIDLAKGLGLPLYDPDSHNAPVEENAHPRVRGNGVIGSDPMRPDVVVASAVLPGIPCVGLTGGISLLESDS